MNNFISLYGEVLDYPQQASIDKKGTEYYKFNLAVQRESGIIDILPIVVEEDTAAYNALADIDEKGEVVGAQLLITGEIRTRNIKDKLDISVRAFSIQEDDDYKGITNQVVITGFLCKEVPIRETPRGLLIADLLLAVHREDGSQLSDYIPSIMWNGTATRATEKLHVGDCIEAVGRLQSREYIKDLGDRGKEPRTCYELSVNQYELQKKKEEEESRSHEEYLKRIEEDPLWELKSSGFAVHVVLTHINKYTKMYGGSQRKSLLFKGFPPLLWLDKSINDRVG